MEVNDEDMYLVVWHPQSDSSTKIFLESDQNSRLGRVLLNSLNMIICIPVKLKNFLFQSNKKSYVPCDRFVSFLNEWPGIVSNMSNH